jgi:phage-related protein
MKIFKDIRIDSYLNRIPKEDHIKITKTIKLFIDYGFKLPEKYLKKLNNLIWELRIEQYRILFGIIKTKIIIVNIFYKKSQKTPKKELKLAVQRLKQQL